MIERVGIDVVEVARIAKAMANPRFAEKILTQEEIQQLETVSPMRLAGRWAAKEAIAKAVSTQLTWHDVVIFNDSAGQPHATILSPQFNIQTHRVHLSISHERGLAAAVAVLERLN